jgi:ABC-2 type transport system permease protein
MNTLHRILVILNYEWRRALAKKKILALVILAVTIQILPLVAFTQLGYLSEEDRTTMWVFGALGGQNLFIQLVAVIIAGGSMSEEYEHGTADIMLSKPLRRIEYLIGKFLGGFLLLVLIEAIMIATAVLAALAFFGPQNNLQFVPAMLLAIAYSSLLFFSLTFMFGELIRKGTLAMLASIGIFMASQILYGVLVVLHYGSQIQLYEDLSIALPTWSSTNLPTFIAKELMPLLQHPLFPLTSGNFTLSAAIIAVYAVVSVGVAITRLLKSDISKKTD